MTTPAEDAQVTAKKSVPGATPPVVRQSATARKTAAALAAASLGLLAGVFAGAEPPAHVAGWLLAAGAGGILVFGSSEAMIGVFLIVLVAGHQFLSPFMITVGSIELHPREVVLLLLLAHAGYRALAARTRLHADPMHAALALYLLFFLFLAINGLLRGYAFQEVLRECRYPLFLLAYPALVLCAQDRDSLRVQTRVLLGLTCLIAVAALTFFAYTLLTGHLFLAQNWLGEFVRRYEFGHLVQSVRPNGHPFFEVGIVVLAAMTCCPATRRREKAWFGGIALVLFAAMAITMMRTAYLSVAISLCALFLLLSPQALRNVLVGLGVCGLVAGVLTAALLGGFSGAGGTTAPDISVLARLEENRGAWEMFLDHPLFGAGMGAAFEGMGYATKTSREAYVPTTFQSIHNVWMYYLYKGGMVGMLTVALAFGGIFVRGLHVAKHTGNLRDRFFLYGLLAALAGQCAASLAMPRLTYPVGHVYLAMTAAAMVVLARPGTEYSGRG